MSTRGKGTSETKAIIKCGLPCCYRLSPRRQLAQSLGGTNRNCLPGFGQK